MSWATPLLACMDVGSHALEKVEHGVHLHSASDVHGHDHDHDNGNRLSPDELCESVCDEIYSTSPAAMADPTPTSDKFQSINSASSSELAAVGPNYATGPPDLAELNQRTLYLTTARLRL